MFDFAATVCPHAPGLNTLSWTSSAHTFRPNFAPHTRRPDRFPAIWSETSATKRELACERVGQSACMTAASAPSGPADSMGHVDHELVRGGPQHVGIVVVGVQGVGLGGQAHPHRGFGLLDQGRVGQYPAAGSACGASAAPTREPGRPWAIGRRVRAAPARSKGGS